MPRQDFTITLRGDAALGETLRVQREDLRLGGGVGPPPAGDGPRRRLVALDARKPRPRDERALLERNQAQPELVARDAKPLADRLGRVRHPAVRIHP
ncbi:MAG: hypothetical protein VW405_13190 [Rhodospirillaceae bacterium]